MTEPFFHAREHGLVVACLNVDHAVWSQPGLCYRGREEIRPCDAPQNLPGCACCNPCREQSCGCAVDCAVSTARNFMKCAARQTAAGESRVQLGDPERKHRFDAPGSALDLFDLRAQ